MDYLKLIGSVASLIGSSNPIVAGGIAAVNLFLDKDKQVPIHATGQNAIDAFQSLPPEKQVQVNKQLQIELGFEQEHTKQIEAAYEHDNSGSSTRPKIAMISCYVCAITAIAFLGLLFLGKSVPDWTVIAAVLSPFILWVNTYINARTKDKRTRYAVAAGQPASLSGLGAIAAQWLLKK